MIAVRKELNLGYYCSEERVNLTWGTHMPADTHLNLEASSSSVNER